MYQTAAIPIATAIRLTVRRSRTDGPRSACRASVGVSIIIPCFFLAMAKASEPILLKAPSRRALDSSLFLPSGAAPHCHDRPETLASRRALPDGSACGPLPKRRIAYAIKVRHKPVSAPETSLKTPSEFLTSGSLNQVLSDVPPRICEVSLDWKPCDWRP